MKKKNVTTPSRLRLTKPSDHEAILWLAGVLVIVGTINVFSSTFIMAASDYGTPYFFFKRHVINLLLAFGGFFAFLKRDYHKWRDLLLPATVVLYAMLIIVLFMSPAINGAQRWISIGGATLQPAEFAKIWAIMLAAYSCANAIGDKFKADAVQIMFFVRLVPIIIAFILVEAEPDMGTACVVAGIPVAMIWIANLNFGPKVRYGAPLLLLVIVAGMLLTRMYRVRRMAIFLDPWQDAQGYGYQTVRSIEAIGSGGFWGMGLGQGLSKYAYLPEAHTDFAFAVFSQENGFVFVLLVLLAYFGIAFFGTRIAHGAKDSLGRLLAMGIVMLISGQAFINLLMISGMGPVVGVPLPFISYGGSSLMVSAIAMGMLYNIGRSGYNYRQSKIIENPMDDIGPTKKRRKKQSNLQLVK